MVYAVIPQELLQSMSGLSRNIIFIFLLACTLAACSPPIGNIGGRGSGPVGDGDYMWAIPYRDAYNVNDLFIRTSDLAVMMSARGLVHSVPVANVAISVIENPNSNGIGDTNTNGNGNGGVTVPPDENYAFKWGGRFVIVVKYNDLQARYSVMVDDPYGIGQPGGNGGSGGGGIVIGWGCLKHGLNPCVFCCPDCGKLKDDCQCPCKACGRKPCICCPQCKTPPGACMDCVNCGRDCKCPCPDCGHVPCDCRCGECHKLLAECNCCPYCEKLVCICPCFDCGRDPCVCPCKVCWNFPCTCCSVCKVDRARCNLSNCPLQPNCDCYCHTCRQKTCICCPVCKAVPATCKCDCKKPGCTCICTECGRNPCQCCPVCGKFGYSCTCPGP